MTAVALVLYDPPSELARHGRWVVVVGVIVLVALYPFYQSDLFEGADLRRVPERETQG